MERKKSKQHVTTQPFVYFNESGEVECLSEKANKWLQSTFKQQRNGDLPEPVWKWIVNQRSALKKGKLGSCSEPFIWGEQKGYIVFQFPNGDPRHSLLLLSEGRPNLKASSGDSKLTEREHEVLEWISAGKTNPEIATILAISPRTVHKHVERILEKLGVENRNAAIAQLLNGSPKQGKRKAR